MSKQTRRSISVKGMTYDRVKKHCNENKFSVSGFIEDVIAESLAKREAAAAEEARAQRIMEGT